MAGPPRKTAENAEEFREKKQQQRQDELDRIPIEGKFGQGKRRFSLGRVMAKLSGTSVTAIAVTFIVMNLEKWLQKLLLWLFFTHQRFQSPMLKLYWRLQRQ